jgi:hypothetical protein
MATTVPGSSSSARRDTAVEYSETHCFAYDQATPYGPVLGLLRQLCDMTDAGGPEAMSTKLRHYLQADDPAPHEPAYPSGAGPRHCDGVYTVLDKVVALLCSRGQMSYWTLKR